jgi:hypothetical protein
MIILIPFFAIVLLIIGICYALNQFFTSQFGGYVIFGLLVIVLIVGLSRKKSK